MTELFLESEFQHKRNKQMKKTGILSKILQFSRQQQIQRIKLFKYYTENVVWDLPCVQQASCLEGGPLLWIWPLYLHVNKKSDDDDDDDDENDKRKFGQNYHCKDRNLPLICLICCKRFL